MPMHKSKIRIGVAYEGGSRGEIRRVDGMQSRDGRGPDVFFSVMVRDGDTVRWEKGPRTTLKTFAAWATRPVTLLAKRPSRNAIRIADIVAALRRQEKRYEENRNFDCGPSELEALNEYKWALQSAIEANLDKIVELAGQIEYKPEYPNPEPFITDEDREAADRMLGLTAPETTSNAFRRR